MPLGVIGLPVLMPIVALLQLLFPGLLRNQWRQYKVAVHTLLTQSTLIFLHWVVLSWFVTQRRWWLSDDVLWQAVVVVSYVGAVYALMRWRRGVREGNAILQRPAGVEYLACGTLVAVGVLWMLYLHWTNSSPWDQMSVVTAAALVALVHLSYRRARAGRADTNRAGISTEAVLLCSLALVGTCLGIYLRDGSTNIAAGPVSGNWPMFRGNEARTGSLDIDDPGPMQPVILWTFDPQERKGRVTFHSSPTVLDGTVYIGAMHSLQTLAEGRIYCVSARQRETPQGPVAAGSLLWKISGEGNLKPVFSSPTVVDGLICIGEGYHQDADCRLWGFHSEDRNPLWSFLTTSHVESSPVLIGARAYFGAGDDGVLCIEGSAELREDGGQSAKKIWQVGEIHVDASPLVAGDLLFVGSAIGDRFQKTEALAIDIRSGKPRWRVPAPMPLPGSPAHAAGRVFFTLGNGKFDEDAEAPAGGVWCLNAPSGEKLWEFSAAGSVLGSPALLNERVYICSRDRRCYCFQQADGKLIWKRDLGGPIVASPIASGDKVYALTTSGQLWCLQAATGELVWKFEALSVPDEDAYSSPTLAGGKLYVAVGGKLYCLGDPTLP